MSRENLDIYLVLKAALEKEWQKNILKTQRSELRKKNGCIKSKTAACIN